MMAKRQEFPVTAAPRMRPVHPGALLREDVLPALGLNVSQAAARLRVSRQTVHRLVGERIGVSPEMALRLGKLCGNGPELWLRMQAAHDLWVARQKLAGEIEQIETVAA